jgi:hypothetical protein
MITTDQVRIVLPKAALTTIFDECDRFDHDETGGRVLGTYDDQRGVLTLKISGLIDSGPAAQRSAVSFFQDGEHQERVFREIERSHPEIEHLGNWHTHHMNGLTTLSSGDHATYHRVVNHPSHNTPFFYALLVVAKRRTSEPLERYTTKHFLFRRGDERAYQIAPKRVEIVDSPLIWPGNAAAQSPAPATHLTKPTKAHPERVYDRDILGEFFPRVRSYTSAKLGLYWRGSIDLLDGSKQEVVVVEDSSSASPAYSVVVRDPPEPLKAAVEQLASQAFNSARAAFLATERQLGLQLYDAARRPKGKKWFS